MLLFGHRQTKEPETDKPNLKVIIPVLYSTHMPPYSTAEICAVDVDDIYSRNKKPAKVKARSLFCYWASIELGISHTDLARKIGISVPGVSYSAERGRLIAKENNYQLME